MIQIEDFVAYTGNAVQESPAEAEQNRTSGEDQTRNKNPEPKSPTSPQRKLKTQILIFRYQTTLASAR